MAPSKAGSSGSKTRRRHQRGHAGLGYHVADTYYLLVRVGPHPYPAMVRDFQSVIGREARQLFLERCVVAGLRGACVGGGSNAMASFTPFRMTQVCGLSRGGGGRGLTPVARRIALRTGGRAARLALLPASGPERPDLPDPQHTPDWITPGGPEHSHLKILPASTGGD
jgi:hypothetical protein